MSETEAVSDPALDKVPVVKPQAVSQPGDLWLLGNSHRLMGADATEPKSYLKFMDGEVAAASIGDPPFNVPSPAMSAGTEGEA